MKEKKMKTTSKTKTGKSGWKAKKKVAKPKVYPIIRHGEALDAALYYAYHDVFSPSSNPCFVIGETARQMIEGERLHDLPFIELGILEKDLTERTKSMLIAILKGDSLSRGPREDWSISKDFVEFDYVPEPLRDHPVVPIKVKIIKKYQKFFRYPDTIFYQYAEYRIPNNWEKYWKIRNLIK